MSKLLLTEPLVSVDWLKANIDHPQLIILDASAHMPGSERNAYEEWQKKRIHGARFFDFNHTICDTSSDLPHMLSNEDVFTEETQLLGINQDSVVVVYDSLGIFSAPRVWWMLTVMGHQHCAVLDGGLPQWEKHSGVIETQTPSSQYTRGNFLAQLNNTMVKNKEQVCAAIDDPSIVTLDARSAARFNGEAKEPREGLISGHIPQSRNLPFTELLHDGCFKSIDQLRESLAHVIDNEEYIYTSCGSGITACVIAFAAQLCGYKNIAVYDGSWSEWGQPELGLPIGASD